MATPMQSIEIQQTPATTSCSCSIEPCGAPAAAEMDARAVCLDHFLSISFRELQARYDQLRNRECEPEETAAFNKSLSLWVGQAQRFSEDTSLEDQATKARLREALAWVTRTGRSLRRSPRFEKSVRVWLRREDSRRTWEEDTWTSTLSRHGASFVCRHPVEIGGTVFLMRKDKGTRAAAHVIYSRMDAEGCRQIGVELIDRDDFWE